VFDTIRNHKNVFVAVCCTFNTLEMDLALQVFVYILYFIEFSVLCRSTEIFTECFRDVFHVAGI